jgi:hypothetical protein
MSRWDAFDRWVRHWGWRVVLVAMVLSALVQVWRMWQAMHAP